MINNHNKNDKLVILKMFFEGADFTRKPYEYKLLLYTKYHSDSVTPTVIVSKECTRFYKMPTPLSLSNPSLRSTTYSYDVAKGYSPNYDFSSSEIQVFEIVSEEDKEEIFRKNMLENGYEYDEATQQMTPTWASIGSTKKSIERKTRNEIIRSRKLIREHQKCLFANFESLFHYICYINECASYFYENTKLSNFVVVSQKLSFYSEKDSIFRAGFFIQDVFFGNNDEKIIRDMLNQ